MTNLFYIQLITSFIAGGITIAGLSYFAERAPKKIAGIVISLPSTVVITYIFIGWTLSAEDVGRIAPATLMMGGVVQLFAIVYIYLSKIKLPKILSIIISLLGGLTIWFLFSLPVVFTQFSDVWLSLLGYALLTIVSYFFLTKKNNIVTNHTLITYSNAQKVGRAIFAGIIITLAVFLSKTLNPFWGGIFGGFPAVYISTFITLHWYYGSDMLFKVAKKIPEGSIVFIAFIFASHWTYPAFGIFGGTVLAYIVSLIFFFILMKLKKN
jgi:hypothetical protein